MKEDEVENDDYEKNELILNEIKWNDLKFFRSAAKIVDVERLLVP